MPEDILNIKVIQKLITINQRLLIVCYYVLVIALVAGMPFAGVLFSSVKICANSGQSVKLLSYIGNNYTDVSLYNANGTHIASWNDDSSEVAHMDPGYSGRIQMDRKRNIWFLNVERNDAGKFYIQFGIYERLEIELTIEEELTEQELQKCPKNHPDFPKEGFGIISLDTTTANRKDDVTEGIISLDTTTANRKDDVTEGISLDTTTAKRQDCVTEGISLDTTTAKRQDCVTEDSSNSLTNGLLLAILIILILDKILTNKNYIRKCWRHWIQERLFQQQLSPENTSETIEESDSLTVDQVQSWLARHPDFMKKYHDEIYKQDIGSTLAEFAVTLVDNTQTDAGVEINQRQHVPTQINGITSETCSSQSSDSFISGMQPISKEEQTAIPEGDKAQTESVESSGKSLKEDSNSDDDPSEALLSESFNPK